MKFLFKLLYSASKLFLESKITILALNLNDTFQTSLFSLGVD